MDDRTDIAGNRVTDVRAIHEVELVVRSKVFFVERVQNLTDREVVMRNDVMKVNQSVLQQTTNTYATILKSRDCARRSSRTRTTRRAGGKEFGGNIRYRVLKNGARVAGRNDRVDVHERVDFVRDGHVEIHFNSVDAEGILVERGIRIKHACAGGIIEQTLAVVLGNRVPDLNQTTHGQLAIGSRDRIGGRSGFSDFVGNGAFDRRISAFHAGHRRAHVVHFFLHGFEFRDRHFGVKHRRREKGHYYQQR